MDDHHIIELIFGILRNLLVILGRGFNQINHSEVIEWLTFLRNITVMHNIAIEEIANFHDWGDYVLSMLIIH